MNSLAYGMVRLAVVSIRKDSTHRAEQMTQLLFGDCYQVLSYTDNRQWLRINTCADNYEGWLDSLQHSPITSGYFKQMETIDYKITTDLMSTLLYNKVLLTIPLGSTLPIASSELFQMEEQFAFNGESKSMGQKRDFDFLKTIALKYLGVPYMWGGKTPLGIDCSGFIQLIFKVCGYKLPRDASQQVLKGTKIDDWDNVQPGDLAFFSNQRDKISHVGLCLDNHRIIHASGKVRVDTLTKEGIIHEEKNTRTHSLICIQRILLRSL